MSQWVRDENYEKLIYKICIHQSQFKINVTSRNYHTANEIMWWQSNQFYISNVLGTLKLHKQPQWNRQAATEIICTYCIPF
jgi:hypothetical protein